MTAGQAVVWYQGQFQALNFLTVYLKTPYQTAYTILMLALVFGTPLFLFFGWLSDRIGRKPIILGGCALAAIAYVPIYQAMVANANITYDAAGKITGANPNILIEEKHGVSAARTIEAIVRDLWVRRGNEGPRRALIACACERAVVGAARSQVPSPAG